MFKIVKTVINTITKDGVTEEKTSTDTSNDPKDLGDDFDKMFKDLELNISKAFNVTSPSSNSRTVKVYGETKERVLEVSNQYAANGYEMVSIRDGLKKKLWEVEMALKIS